MYTFITHQPEKQGLGVNENKILNVLSSLNFYSCGADSPALYEWPSPSD